MEVGRCGEVASSLHPSPATLVASDLGRQLDRLTSAGVGRIAPAKHPRLQLVSHGHQRRGRHPIASQCFLKCSAASVVDECSALVRLSARFSLRDLPDFFFIVWRGDLSDIVAPSFGGLVGPNPLTLRLRSIRGLASIGRMATLRRPLYSCDELPLDRQPLAGCGQPSSTAASTGRSTTRARARARAPWLIGAHRSSLSKFGSGLVDLVVRLGRRGGAERRCGQRPEYRLREDERPIDDTYSSLCMAIAPGTSYLRNLSVTPQKCYI